MTRTDASVEPNPRHRRAGDCSHLGAFCGALVATTILGSAITLHYSHIDGVVVAVRHISKVHVRVTMDTMGSVAGVCIRYAVLAGIPTDAGCSVTGG